MTPVLLSALALAAPTPGELRLSCSQQSEGMFSAGFGHPANLTAGPLALMGGGEHVSEEIVRELGGTKYPLIVKPRRRVTFSVSGPGVRLTAAGRPRTLEAGYRRLRLRACGRAGSKSEAGGRRVTFWPSFVIVDGPRCVHLRIRVHGRARVLRRRVALGRPCAR